MHQTQGQDVNLKQLFVPADACMQDFAFLQTRRTSCPMAIDQGERFTYTHVRSYPWDSGRLSLREGLA